MVPVVLKLEEKTDSVVTYDGRNLERSKVTEWLHTTMNARLTMLFAQASKTLFT